MQDWLAEDEVTAEKVAEAFTASGTKARADDDRRVLVSTDFDWLVLLDPDKKMLIFQKAFAFREDAAREDKLDFLNTLNHTVIMARFSMPREDLLVADYYLSYERGLHPHQLARSFRLFNVCVSGMGGALRKFDEKGLMK